MSESTRGAALQLGADEKLAVIQLACQGFGEDIQVRQIPGGTEWYLGTPAKRGVFCIEGRGPTPEAAIEDAWAQLTEGPIVLSVTGMVPRRLVWDGIRFC